ncbi:hypothetical protein F4825DRAFT_455071 [Nemania diffusa]|nr:hypothetical protein F4825DRAFT_455071 [Nemania diffusa]
MGKVPIATDPSNCYSGYSYFCCDNPNAPALPAPGDVAVCDAGPNPVGASPDADSDESNTSGGFFLEGETTLASSCDLATLSLTEVEIALVLSNASDLQDSTGALMPRGVIDKKAIMNLCLAGKEINKLSPQTYTGAQNLIKTFQRSVYVVGKSLVCGAFQLTSLSAKPEDQSIVTEHVFEKQQFRDLLQKMMAGTVRTGTRLQVGALQAKVVFDQGGVFYQKWPDITALPAQFRPYGSTIHDSFMGVLGRTADKGIANSANIDNLQVLERATNGTEALVIAGNKFVGDAKWTSLGPLQKIGELSRLLGVCQYMGIGPIQDSYKTTFGGILSLMGLFSNVLSANGTIYNAVAGMFRPAPTHTT